MAMGGMLWAGAVSLGAEGTITGAGPSDPKQRKLLEVTGWRPYSIRYRKDDGSTAYFSYQRFDPFGIFLGITADYTELAGGMSKDDMWETAGKAMVATVKQLGSKSYLQGLTEFLDAVQDPDAKSEKLLKSLAASFAPNVLSKMNSDQYMREARSVMDAVRRKVPGFSEELDPVRNILGEPVTPPPTLGPSWLSPFVSGVHVGSDQPMTPDWKASPRDDVKDEMARLAVVGNRSFTHPPLVQGSVDLTDYRSPVTGKTAYDRYLELTGTVKMGGKTLHDALQQEIRGGPYRELMTDGDDEEDYTGSRIGYVKSILGGYRLLAMEALKKEIPDLGEALKQDQIMRARALVRSRSQN